MAFRASTFAFWACGAIVAVGCGSSSSPSTPGGNGGSAGAGGSANAGTGGKPDATAGRGAGGSGGVMQPAGGTAGNTQAGAAGQAQGGAAGETQGGAPGGAGSAGDASGDAGAPACSSTDTRCTSNTEVEVCGADGQWGPATTCPYVCVAKNCGGTCVPGDKQCASSTQVETCNPDGQWGNASTCPFGCGDKACLTDYSLQFDGTDDIVTVPYSASLDVTAAVTLEAWVYATSAAGGAIGSMWGAGGLADKYLLQLSGGNVVARIVRPGVSGQTTAQATMPLNTWTHVAFTYDGTDMLIYLNGVQAASTSAPGTLPAANLPFRMGIEDINLGVKSILSGQLDEVRLWNVARTANEISTNYQASISPSSAGLIAYWNFNEAQTSQTVLDATSGGHNGTLGADATAAADDPTRVAR